MEEYKTIGILLIMVALIIALVGAVIYFAGASFSWFGNLPGDLKVERKNFTFYFPLATMLVLSVVLSIIIKLMLYFFN
jgi:H+/Cl- antiporter ClcA